MMDWDNRTRTGARASGVEERRSSHGGAFCSYTSRDDPLEHEKETAGQSVALGWFELLVHL